MALSECGGERTLAHCMARRDEAETKTKVGFGERGKRVKGVSEEGFLRKV